MICKGPPFAPMGEQWVPFVLPFEQWAPLRMVSQLNYTPTTSEVHAGEEEKSNFFLDGAVHNRFLADYQLSISRG